MRLAKVLRFGGKRLNGGLDLYNLFREPADGNPRVLRFNVQFDF